MMCQAQIKHASVIANVNLRHISRNVLRAVVDCCRLISNSIRQLMFERSVAEQEKSGIFAWILCHINWLEIVYEKVISE